MLDVALIPTAGSSSGIFVIDIHTGAIVRQLKDSTSTTVVPTADGYICAAQSNKGLLHYWKIADGIDDDDDDATLRGMASNPCYKCSTPEKLLNLLFTQGPAQLLIGGGISGTIYIWQLSTGRLLRTWKAHYSGVTQMCLTADGSFLVTAGQDTTVKVFTLSSLITSGGGGGKPLVLCVRVIPLRLHLSGTPSPARVFRGHTLPVNALKILQEVWTSSHLSEPSKILITSGSADGSVKVWEFIPGGSGRQVATFNLPTPVKHIALSLRDPLYAGGDDGRVHVIDFESKETSVLTGSHESGLVGLGCSIDGSRVVSVAADGLRVWDVFSGQTIKQISTAQLSLQPPCGLTMLSRVDLVGQSMGSIAPRFQALQRVLTPVDELETVPVPSRKVDSKKSASIEDVFEIDLERERKQSPVSCLTYGLLEDVFASSACDDAVTKANEVRDKWQNVAYTLYQQSTSSSSPPAPAESGVVIPPVVMEAAVESTKEPEAGPKVATVERPVRPKRKAANKSIKKKKKKSLP
ncbi:WD repeat-containing protein crb3, putative [Perkinsus marinus ATCC 50983]|uniref:WD repeat-containing protein crb3, putative n=1 Tax=Perkinsus marinus (strain ATCC 50983 / TXsc) TaxID=423536 RepID=C5KTG4_PERM5|nr:WD repeat-containing protein crb3, putative [Perkinsus marinus ATCC 50983]EER12269.1 WD repeat-containing protein crb3, putative [Perkinsus marinus ATCC 50983]|eukprot:XP_002780474.1 WD repeat-containing protein crb3, putative [Perkinsus marinus ATCC 50983]